MSTAAYHHDTPMPNAYSFCTVSGNPLSGDVRFVTGDLQRCNAIFRPM